MTRMHWRAGLGVLGLALATSAAIGQTGTGPTLGTTTGTQFTPVRTISNVPTGATTGLGQTKTGQTSASSTTGTASSGSSSGLPLGGTAQMWAEILTLADMIATVADIRFQQPWEETFFVMLVAKMYFQVLAESQGLGITTGSSNTSGSTTTSTGR